MPLWTEFREALRQPEYIHVLLNPLPIYGLATGVLGLLAALAARSRPAQTLALVLILLTSAAAWPTAHFGHSAYDRVYSMSGTQAQAWLNWHQNLAERAAWACYVTAALAAASVAGFTGVPRVRGLLASFTLLAAIIALVLGGFAAYAGGKIRHSEFRSAPPPAWADTSVDSD